MTLAADSLKETKIKQHRCTYKTIIYLQGVLKIKFCEIRRCFQVSINLQSLHTFLTLKKKNICFQFLFQFVTNAKFDRPGSTRKTHRKQQRKGAS